MNLTDSTFQCTICLEPSIDLCEYCTRDTCPNHLCEKCGRCSDCCTCLAESAVYES